MDFGTITSFVLSSTSTSSVVASRPFSVAFLLTLLGRLIAEAQNGITGQAVHFVIPMLAQVQGLHLPLWMMSDSMILLLGGLMLAEWYIENHNDLRPMLEGLKTHLVKPGVNALMQFGMVQGQGALILNVMAHQLPHDTLAWLITLGPGVAVASTSLVHSSPPMALGDSLGWLVTAVSLIWALVMAGGTWFVALLRHRVVALLHDLDPQNSLGLITLFGLAEGGWTITLTLVLILAPIVALVLTGLTVLSLLLIRKWFERREERAKVACPACATPMHATALFCPACRQPNPHPRKVGLFGQPKNELVMDRTDHRLRLTARKRCPSCATRLTAKAFRQRCSACDTMTFADVSELNVYLRALDKKLPLTLVICGVLGFVPVLGLVPGMVYYQLSLLTSLRGYIPSAVGCLTRWGLRIANAILVMLQPFFLGWLTLPVMALLNYLVYRHVLRSGLGALPPPVPAGGGTSLGGARFATDAPIRAAQQLPVITEATPPNLPGVCPTCNAPYTANSRFCTTCGTKLGTAGRAGKR